MLKFLAKVPEDFTMIVKEKNGKYKLWGCDHSNSVENKTTPSVKGSFLWIWDSDSIQDQLAVGEDAVPLSCLPHKTSCPCDLLDVFLQNLTQLFLSNLRQSPHRLLQIEPEIEEGGKKLGDLSSFGPLHGVIQDPSNCYVTANIFAPSGGYIGITDTQTKEAVGLFRVSKKTGTSTVGSIHTSRWTNDGLAIIVANLHSKMIERIDVKRNLNMGKITNLYLNQIAGVYIGNDFTLL